jgi:hypothetical protein
MNRTCVACRFAFLLLILLAFFLRFYRLSAQSFWNDEGNSARIAERSLKLIWEGAAADIHPPGYYLLLHYWRALCGHSEFALRAFSALAGVVSVAFTFLLGRRLFGVQIGLLAAFISAISPLAVYYAQEARMYAFLGMLSVLSTCFMISASYLPYLLTCVVGLYTHYAFPFVLFVHNLLFGLWWLMEGRRLPGWRRRVLIWIALYVVMVALYLPWLPIAIRSVTGWPAAERDYRLAEALLEVLRVLVVGLTLTPAEGRLALVGGALLLLMALWPRGDSKVWPGITGMVLYLAVPIFLIFVFKLYKPEWLKFLIIVLSPAYILMARGAENAARLVARRLSVVLSVLVLLPCLLPVFSSLHHLYFDPAYARDDYRGIAASIAARVRPGDAIILNAPNQWEVFTYYYPDRDVYPAPYRPEPSEVENFLSPLAGRYRRFFVLYWGDAESDPGRLVESWLAGHTYKAADSWHGRVRLALYGVATLPEAPTGDVHGCFGGEMCLLGYALPGLRFGAGDIIPVSLFWRAQREIGGRYKVTVQLLNSSGELVAQCDAEPEGGLLPTDRWQEGLTITDRYGILLPSDLVPGRYVLIVAVYHISTGVRLPVSGSGASAGDHIHIADVEIVTG